MWNGRGAKAERGGRVSKTWIRALPGSTWENCVPWKHECSIFGMTSRRHSHDSFTRPAQLQSGWLRPSTTSGTDRAALHYTWGTTKGHPKSCWGTASPTHDPFAMVFMLHLLLPLLPPQGLSPVGLLQCRSQMSSQAAFWGEDTGKLLFMLQKPVPYRFITMGQAPWSPNLTVFSLPDRTTFPVMEVCFLKDEFTTLRTSAAWYKMSPNLQ